MTEQQREAVQVAAIKAAFLGRRFPSYEPLDAFEDRVAKRLDIIAEQAGREPTVAETKKVQREESNRQRAAVAGFDIVFAPVKSAAVLWALDERGDVRAAVRAAHEAARDAAIELLEEHAAFTRTGDVGQAQIATRGLIAAAFDHYDSRAGDLNLHTHVAVSNKVLGVDGKWRSLDARELYAMTVAASEFYNTRFEVELTARLGVGFAARSDTPRARSRSGRSSRCRKSSSRSTPPAVPRSRPATTSSYANTGASTATTRREAPPTCSLGRLTSTPVKARRRSAP